MILILYQLDYKIATYVYFNLDLKNVLHLRDGSPYMKNVNEIWLEAQNLHFEDLKK